MPKSGSIRSHDLLHTVTYDDERYARILSSTSDDVLDELETGANELLEQVARERERRSDE